MKKEIVICLGSSCFSRGNKQTVNIIKDYLREHHLSDKVFFHGTHCLNKCDKGPVLQIDKKQYDNVTPENVRYILKDYFSKENC